ncbi:ABC transporter ATP-binding protein [Diplocloster hominis]|uniref:ABC transporter ATP-binding protein n=1 Tax=Diplocloster hominis TaxID=3079010 RepID=UPI0031BB5723
MKENIAIQVEDITKIYKLYNKPSDRLKESLGLTRQKRHRDHYALKHLNFDVFKGETVGIIGTNGSGKSTILKIITGVLNPTGGNISIDGRISALLELGAGFNMEYTGIENIYLNGTMIGFSEKEIDEKLDDILEFADIGEFVNQPVKTYSSGMFVRLAFAVAINIDPEILIVDEALSVGDVFFQAKCYHKFEEFKRLGKTILFVSHDLSSISKYCDRVILLNQGEKVAEGKPKQIVDLYKKILVHQFDPDQEGVTRVTDTPGENTWKSHFRLNPEQLEYGEKQAEIVDFAVIDEEDEYSTNIIKGKKFKIKMKVQFHSTVNEPIFAFTIKNLQGTEITGTNTMFEHIYISPQNEGDVREVSFEQDMPLQGGEYLLSLGCTGYRNGDFAVYHRLYDVCGITVISDKDTVGFFDLNSQIEVS